MKNNILLDIEKTIVEEKAKAAVIDSLPVELEQFTFRHLLTCGKYTACFDAETAGEVVDFLKNIPLMPLELHKNGCCGFDVAGTNTTGKNTALNLPFTLSAECMIFDGGRKNITCRIQCYYKKNIAIWFDVKNPPFDIDFTGRFWRGRVVRGTAGFSLVWHDEKIKALFSDAINYYTGSETTFHKTFYK